MIIKTSKTYHCDHCKRRSFILGTIEAHEPLCSRNPDKIDKPVFVDKDQLNLFEKEEIIKC